MDLKGQVAMVTGASSGIGVRIADALAKRGVRLALTYRGHPDEASRTAKQVKAQGVDAVLCHLDQTDPASCDDAIKAVFKGLGRIDILVNNAGMNHPVPYPDLDGMTPEIWDRVFNTNLRGAFLMTRAAANHLKEHGRGRVINMSGFPGIAPMGSSIALAVSKAAIIQLTRCLAVALAPKVAVNCIAPGLVEGTGMTGKLPETAIAGLRERALLKRTTSVDDVVRQVLLLCEADGITGQTHSVDAGLVFH
jgi:3-oxoacyl-[acyl-carrier protein] reductase